MIDSIAFKEARRRVLLDSESRDDGIGRLSEKVTHKILKLCYEPDESFHEVEFLGKIADIKNEKGIYEIQTASFSYLIPKLKRFLPECPVTVVYPIAAKKTVRWVDKTTNEISPPRRAPRGKTVFDAGRELYKIREFFGSENLTVRLVLLECEEFKLLDGKDKTRKRGATRIDRIPTAIIDEIELRGIEDFRIFLPDSLGEEFTAKEYMKAAGTRSRYVYYSMKLMEHLGFIEHIRNDGRAFVYKRI